jgi:hypothetical protein
MLRLFVVSEKPVQLTRHSRNLILGENVSSMAGKLFSFFKND